MSEGFIKIHRKITEWEWYGDTNTYRVFTHLLFEANWKDKKWRGRLIERGALVTSLQLLADQCGISVQNVRTALDHLRSTGEINIQSDKRGTYIKVCNYASYQDIKTTSNTPPNTLGNTRPTHDQHRGNTEVTSKEEGKEEKESKERKKIGGIADIQQRIAKLGNWSPHLNYAEQSDLADNAGKWFDLTDRDWEVLESWYAAPSNSAPYRSGKSKLLRSPDEEVVKAESNGFPKSAKPKTRLSDDEKAERNRKLFGDTVIASDLPAKTA